MKRDAKQGYFVMQNVFYDAVAGAGFTVTERGVLDCIVRYTFGFNRSDCAASVSFIRNYFGGTDRAVRYAIDSLVRKKVLIVTREHTAKSAKWFRINLDFSQWEGLEKRGAGWQCGAAQGGNGVPEGMAMGCRSDWQQSAAQGGSEMPVRNYNIENTTINNKDSGGTTPPTLEAVAAYCEEQGYHVNPERFWNFYQSTGWVLSGGKRITDWRYALANWEIIEHNKPEEQEIETDCYGRPIPPKYEG